MDAGEWFRWIAAFVLGALSAVVIEFARGQFERRQRRADRRDDFQRETLLALQDALMNSGVLTFKAYLPAMKQEPIPDPLQDDIIAVTLLIKKLSVRIYDDQTRALVDTFLEANDRVAAGENDADHTALRGDLISSLAAVVDRIGEVLRAL